MSWQSCVIGGWVAFVAAYPFLLRWAGRRWPGSFVDDFLRGLGYLPPREGVTPK